MESRKNDWWRRAVRGFVQLAAGGGLTIFVDQIVKDVPDRYDFYVLAGATTLVTLAQNFMEDNVDWFPAVLKGKPSSGANPVPDPNAS